MINQATLLGRVGKIDTKTTQTGVKITNISMVTNKKYVKNGEKVEKTTWHNVTAFNKVSEIAEKYVAVGDLLYIQGEMESQKYTGHDGVEKTKNFIIAQTLQLMPKAKEHKPAPAKDADYNSPDFFDSEIPF